MRIVPAVCLAAMLACGSDLALQGSARIDAVFNVPSTGVGCIRLVASGMKRSVQKDFGITAGQSALSFDMHAIPTGTVMFSGSAYAESCSGIIASSIATWVADDATVTISPGPPALVQLDFHPNGNATVGGNFVGDSFTVTTLAGLAGTAGAVDGTGAEALFEGPTALAFDGVDTLYLADRTTATSGSFTGMTIRRITVSTGVVTTLAGDPGSIGTADGDGTAARFALLGALALSGSMLYIGDGCALRAMTTTQPYAVTTLLGTPSATNPQAWDCSSGIGSILDIAARGPDLYIADQVRAVISKISFATSPPTVTVVAGSTGVTGTADGTLSSAEFLGPLGIVFPLATDDVFFVADWGTSDGTHSFGLIRRVSHSDNSVTTLAGAEQTGFVMTDGLGLNALFAEPRRIANDGTNLFITDISAVRRLDLHTEAVVTVAGSNTAGYADAVGVSAGFNWPFGIARNAATASMYVADQKNFTIRVLRS